MDDRSVDERHVYAHQPFDQAYFHSGPYADVSFRRFSQYWWSNRFYARLAMHFGPKRGAVLEVGCGLGHLIAWMAGRYSVFGSDINAWALSQARRNVPLGNFVLASAEDLGAFPEGSFQILIAKHVVEHLEHPERAIAEMSRVLVSGGLLLLATPNLGSPMRALKKEQWIGYQDKTHISLKSPAAWLEILKRQGFNVRRIFSDGFWDAPYVRVLPTTLQKLLFGAPGGLQALLGWGIIPLRMGESMILLAEKV